jgi:hypothetical protein
MHPVAAKSQRTAAPEYVREPGYNQFSADKH